MSKESNKRESRPDQQANQSIFSILGLGAKCQVTSAAKTASIILNIYVTIVYVYAYAYA